MSCQNCRECHHFKTRSRGPRRTVSRPPRGRYLFKSLRNRGKNEVRFGAWPHRLPFRQPLLPQVGKASVNPTSSSSPPRNLSPCGRLSATLTLFHAFPPSRRSARAASQTPTSAPLSACGGFSLRRLHILPEMSRTSPIQSSPRGPGTTNSIAAFPPCLISVMQSCRQRLPDLTLI